MGKEHVILVDEKDEPVGMMEKIEAHEKGFLHRAFSVFVYNDKNQLMVHQRSLGKYHSPGLWTNTCCSHQRGGETNTEAGKRRLMEEMGFETELEERGTFIYKAPFDNGLTEHEFDHILIGTFNGEPRINTDEVANWKWMDLGTVKDDMLKNPEQYTAWFKIVICDHYDAIRPKV